MRPGKRLVGLTLPWLLWAGLAPATLAPATPAHATPAPALVQGSLILTRCRPAENGYCGNLLRPLDPAHPTAGAISVGFEFYPHSDLSQPGLGAIVAQEGGPGFATTGSRDGYTKLFAPLRARRDLILVDKRGTGSSAAINCPALQRTRDPTAGDVRACAQKLGSSAWLYSSAFAADDLAAVLQALRTGPVDFYGDSYGTYFAEIFAARHPQALRTLVLDSAYPVNGDTVYFASEIENFAVSMERVCARAPNCAGRFPSVTTRFDSLLDQLRHHPVRGWAPGANGELLHVTADPSSMFLIAYLVGNNLVAYRDLDAATRALDQGDRRPLLRLVAEAHDGGTGDAPATDFSVGLADAVICADYRRPYDLRASPATRHAQFAAAMAETQAKNPKIFAPFTLEDALYAPENPESLDSCIDWPNAPAWATPGVPVAPDAPFPNIPVLVMAGELDTVTSPKEAAQTTALFPKAWFVVLKNMGHEVAIGNGGSFVPPMGSDLARCAGPIVLNFIARGGDPGDVSCALAVRPIRPVPDFATSWTQLPPATPAAGNNAADPQRRLAAAATATLGDAVARYAITQTGTDRGLRGGFLRLTRTETGYRFRLTQLRWTNDLAITGTIDWNQLDDTVEAQIRLAAPGHTGTLHITWNDRVQNAQATLTGQIDGTHLAATILAP